MATGTPSWHVYVDGQPCVAPAQLSMSVYTANSASTNPHRQRSLIGTCTATAAGPIGAGEHEVRIYVAEELDAGIGCNMGRLSTATLMVEGIP